MAQKSKRKTKTISVRPPPDLADWVKKKAAQDRRSSSSIIVGYLLKEMAADPN